MTVLSCESYMQGLHVQGVWEAYGQIDPIPVEFLEYTKWTAGAGSGKC